MYIVLEILIYHVLHELYKADNYKEKKSNEIA